MSPFFYSRKCSSHAKLSSSSTCIIYCLFNILLFQPHFHLKRLLSYSHLSHLRTQAHTLLLFLIINLRGKTSNQPKRKNKNRKPSTSLQSKTLNQKRKKKKVTRSCSNIASMDFITTPVPGIPISGNIKCGSTNSQLISNCLTMSPGSAPAPAPLPPLSRYENQKRRDWNTFCQYLRNHRPPLAVPLCSSSHVLEFLRYLDQFGKTKVHNQACPFFGIPNPPAPCPCPLRQAWGSLDALIGRLRAAYEEHGGLPEANPFGARAVRLFLRDVRDFQSKSRGISYEKKRKRAKQQVAIKSPAGVTLPCGETNAMI